MNLAASHLIEHLDDSNVGWQQAWDEYEDACSTERQHLGMSSMVSDEKSEQGLSPSPR